MISNAVKSYGRRVLWTHNVLVIQGPQTTRLWLFDWEDSGSSESYHECCRVVHTEDLGQEILTPLQEEPEKHSIRAEHHGQKDYTVSSMSNASQCSIKWWQHHYSQKPWEADWNTFGMVWGSCTIMSWGPRDTGATYGHYGVACTWIISTWMAAVSHNNPWNIPHPNGCSGCHMEDIYMWEEFVCHPRWHLWSV